MTANNPLVQALVGTEGLIAPQKPKDLFASLLIKNGLDTSPIHHPLQGAARLAQALLGGMELRGRENDENMRRAAPDAIAQINNPAPAPQPRTAGPPPGFAPAAPPQGFAPPAPDMPAPRVASAFAAFPNGGTPPAMPQPNDPTMTVSPRQVAQANPTPAGRVAGGFDAAQPPGANPVQTVPVPGQPGLPIDARIDQLRQHPNPYVRAFGNQQLMEREAQRLKPPELQVIGKDPQGNDQRGWVNAADRTISPLQAQAPNFVDTKKLRDEVRDLPSYKNLAQAAPVYKSMFDAAGRDNRAADVNLIYGMAKIMDPGSVVRESEMSVAQAVATLPQNLQSQIMSQLNSTGRLSPDVRAAIMQEAHSRIAAYQGSFETDMGMYRGIAQSGQFNPAHVIPTFGPFDQFKPPSSAAAPAAAPQQRPRARNAAGQVIEHDGQQWVPVQ